MNNLMKNSTRWLFMLAFWLVSNAAWAQASLSVSNSGGGDPYTGCERYTVTFTGTVNPGTKTITNVELDFGGGDVVSGTGTGGWQSTDPWVYSRILDAGTYQPTLIVTYASDPEEKKTIPKPIVVYSLPKADFALATDTEQCFAGNKFIFTDLSQPGKDGNKVIKWSWDVGDGTTPYSKQNPTHSYKFSNNYDVSLRVTDEKGCVKDTLFKKFTLVYPSIGVNFTANGNVGCPVASILFRNKTTVAFNLVEKWVWDWGTGKKFIDTFYADSANHVNNWWSDFSRDYHKDGYSSPKLVVFTKDGCVDSMVAKNAVRVVNYWFDIVWAPDVPCFYQNSITFRMDPRPLANQWLWNFGDPASMILNTNNDSWSPAHKFVGGPGWYNISLAILEAPCPVRDTTICFVKLQGPSAAINLPPPPTFPPNNCRSPREIPLEDFERLKYDNCYRNAYDPKTTQYAGAAKGQIKYVKVDYTSSKSDSEFVYCNAVRYPVDVMKRFDSINAEWIPWDGDPDSSIVVVADKCGPEPPKVKDSSLIKYVFDTIWRKEDPQPGVNGEWRYRYNNYSQTFVSPVWDYKDSIPYVETLLIEDFVVKLSDPTIKIKRQFTIAAPFLRPHILIFSGEEYVYRPKSPITHITTGITNPYYPPMYAGTAPPDCGTEYRTMHDSDKFTLNCSGPNLVTFKNNSVKYRVFGRVLDQLPPATDYSDDNHSAAFMPGVPYAPDSCADNPNLPWASDSMVYFWDFGDGNPDQCTTMAEVGGKYIVSGNNPSGNPLLCGYSFLVAPKHLYKEEGCWTAILNVFDPVTGCKSVSQQPIVMEAPFGGPGEPAGKPTVYDVNYYNQRVLLDDKGQPIREGVIVGRGAAPCAGNQLNPYFQRIEVGATVPRCGRETFWMVLDKDAQCVCQQCRKESGGEIQFVKIKNRGTDYKPGTYNVTFVSVKKGSKAVPARGTARINAFGFLDKVTLTSKGSDFLKVDTALMEFDNSDLPQSGTDYIKVIATTAKDTSFQNCGWLDEPTLQMIGMQWSYGTAGWKDLGIVIKVGDCLDTFFYEDYKYIVNANANWLMSPRIATAGNTGPYLVEDPRFAKVITDDLICNDPHDAKLLPNKLPRVITLSMKDSLRNDAYSIMQPVKICDSVLKDYKGVNDSVVPVSPTLDSIRTLKFFISQIADNCGQYSDGLLEDSLELFDGGWRGKDVVGSPLLVNLHDTIMYTFKRPGKFIISASAKAVFGDAQCFGGLTQETWVGQLQCFTISDQVVCGFQPVRFIDSVFYWHKSGQSFCDFIGTSIWNNTCIEGLAAEDDLLRERAMFYYPITARDPFLVDPTYKFPDYQELVAWDFNADPTIEDYQRKLDSSMIEIWGNHTPIVNYGMDPIAGVDMTLGLGVGKYDVTLWARDSMGCWTPATVKNAVRVVEVTANFKVCDGCFQDFTCTPARAIFNDSSLIHEWAGYSVVVGAEDSVLTWEWDFGDGRLGSQLRDPFHIYYTADTFDVTLKITTLQGCFSEITKKEYIRVNGPNAKFSVDTLEGCVPFNVTASDSSEFPNIKLWQFDLGDGSPKPSYTSKPNDVVLTYKKSGNYLLTMSITADVFDKITGDTTECTAVYPNYDAGEDSIKIYVRDLDSIAMTLSDTLICPGDEVRFTLDDAKTYAGYESLFWKIDLADTTALHLSGRLGETKQTFNDPGRYKVALTGNGDWSNMPICPDITYGHVSVKKVTAKLELGEGRLRHNPDIGQFVILNKSENGVVFTWDIIDLGTAQFVERIVRTDTSLLYYDKLVGGKYLVVLTVADDTDPAKACKAFDTLTIEVIPVAKTYNVFTPNGDGVNDWFEVDLQAAREYEIVIFNRWGQVHFKATKDDNIINCYYNDKQGNMVCKVWDGKNYKTKDPAPAGTYFFTFKYKLTNGDKVETVAGTVTLIR